MKRMVHRSEPAFAVERTATKEQCRSLLEERRDAGKCPDNSGVDCVRSWRHTLQAGVSLQCRHWRINGTGPSDRAYLCPNVGPSQWSVWRTLPPFAGHNRLAPGALIAFRGARPGAKFYRARGISPKSQNTPAMMPSASSVTDQRMCS